MLPGRFLLPELPSGLRSPTGARPERLSLILEVLFFLVFLDKRGALWPRALKLPVAAAVGGEEKCLAPGGAVPVPVPGWEEQLWDVPREGGAREGPSCVAKAIIIIIIIKFLPALLSEKEGLLLFFPPSHGAPSENTTLGGAQSQGEAAPAPPGAFIGGGGSSLRAWGPR